MTLLGYFIIVIVWTIWLSTAVRALYRKNNYNKFLLTSAALIPFYSVSFGFFGFQFSIFKILPLFLISMYLLSRKLIRLEVFVLLTYFFMISIIVYFFALYEGGFNMAIDLGRSEFHAYVQPIVQGIFFITLISQLWMLRQNLDIDHIKILSYFIYACILLVLIGYLQLFAYYNGLPWFSYWWLDDAIGRASAEGMAAIANDRNFYRMSSLGGEPRHLSSVLALSLMLQQYLKTTNIVVPYLTGYRSYLTSIFLLSGMLFSFSSSGLLSLIIGFGLYFLLTNFIKMALFVCIISVFFVFSGDYNFINNLVWKLSSIEMVLYAAPKDAFALKAIFDSWIHFIVGYGINLADLFVPDYYLLQETPFGISNRYETVKFPMESSIVPTSPILQILLNGGVFGLFLVLFFAYKEMHSCRRTTKVFFISLIGMLSVSSTLIFAMAWFFLSVIINFEKVTSYRQYRNRNEDNVVVGK